MIKENTPKKRTPIVGVIGSGKSSPNDEKAYQLGKLIVKEGYILLTGGGGGIMTAASQGAAEENGIVIGILPSNGPDDPMSAGRFPNPYVNIPIYTGMAQARNIINVKSSDVVVVFPGGAGTLSEVAMSLNVGKPVVVVGWSELRLPQSCPSEIIYHVNEVTDAIEVIKDKIFKMHDFISF